MLIGRKTAKTNTKFSEAISVQEKLATGVYYKISKSF